MKFLSRLLLLCLLGWGGAFAQNLATTINASSCEKPDYPSSSKRLEEEGTVQLKFLVGADGKVIESAVEKSSGFRRLDEAARQSLSKCTFKPGTKDGVAVESWASMKYTWKLNVFTPCVGSDVSKWRSCLGTLRTLTGGLSVVEYEVGKKSGRGIEYDSSGKVLRAGIFEGENLVSERNLDPKLYPFDTQLLANSANQLLNTTAVRPNISSSNLPACPPSTSLIWHNCVGERLLDSNLKYVGTFRDNNASGEGVLYRLNESVVVAGNGNFNSVRNNENLSFIQRTNDYSVLLKKYPFNSNSHSSLAYATPVISDRDGLAAEVESERKKRQDLEQQLAAAKERESITAELDFERKKRQELEAQLAASVKPPPTQSNAPRRIAHALVIGNAAYPGSGRLDNPVNDANAISQKLRSMGFTVTTVTDANRQRLVQSMAQFRRTAASADISLLYYAGHGVQIFGTNYILPTDVDQTDPAQATIQGVSLNSVVENFLPGKTKLVFLDACRDNALQRTNDRSVSKGLAPISAAEGTLISYATKDGQTAADGVGSKNSPFTQALLEHLNDPQDIAVVLRKVRERVMKITGGKQQPWEYGSLTGGELVLSAIKPK